MAPDDQLTTELKLRDRYAPSAENRQGTLCAKPPGTRSGTSRNSGSSQPGRGRGRSSSALEPFAYRAVARPGNGLPMAPAKDGVHDGTPGRAP
jgi:hypothetical protein